MIDNNVIVSALQGVLDPETGINIIRSKLISGLKIDGNQVQFALEIKSTDAEVKSKLHMACMEAIAKVAPEANVHIHMKSNAGPASGKPLGQIKNIIAVASGKGGVGKSTVAVNMAIGLVKQGYKVGLMDADLYGPSVPMMLGETATKPKVQKLYGQNKILPIETHDLHMISIGNIVDPEQAIVLRGPRLGGIIKQFISECLWPELDFMIIDLPPGTGDVQLSLVQSIAITGAVIVTTPQEVSVIDAVKAMNMFMLAHVNVPILGVVENMAWFTPAELPDNKYLIFGKGGGKALARKSNSMVIGQLPLVQAIREGGDDGNPIAAKDDPIMKPLIDEMVLNLIRQVNIRNEMIAPTETVKIK